MKLGTTNRREFLKTTAAAAALGGAIPYFAFGPSAVAKSR